MPNRVIYSDKIQVCLCAWCRAKEAQSAEHSCLYIILNEEKRRNNIRSEIKDDVTTVTAVRVTIHIVQRLIGPFIPHKYNARTEYVYTILYFYIDHLVV